MPLLLGIKAVLHPTPLQPHEIVRRIKDAGATILLSTDTFMSQYARAGEQGDLNSLRLAVCGAERVRDETRAAAAQEILDRPAGRLWRDRDLARRSPPTSPAPTGPAPSAV